MGLNTQSHERKTFLNIVNGKFAKRVAEGTPNSVEREIEYEGVKKTIHELHYSDLDAKIAGIELKEGDKFGDTLHINCSDNGETFTMSLSLASREAKGFMNCLPNIDLTKNVNFQPYNYERKKDGKKMIGLGIKYTGDKDNVPYFYTAENGMPSVPLGGDMDKDEFKILMKQQEIFLKKATKKLIAEKFSAPAGTTQGLPNNQTFEKPKNAEQEAMTKAGEKALDDATSDMPF